MKYLIAILALCFALSAPAQEVKLRLLDKWQCAELLCGIAMDEEGNYLMVIGDKEGLLYVYFRGKLVFDRNATQPKKEPT